MSGQPTDRSGLRPWSAWLRPPELEGVEAAMRARVAHWVLLTGITVLLLLLVTLPILQHDSFPYDLVYGFSLVALLLGYALLRLGHVRLAAGVACSMAWLIVMAVSLTSGGVSSPQLATMVLVIMLVGFLWSSRAAIGFAVVTSLSLLGLLGFAHGQLLPGAAPRPTPLTEWSALTAVLAMAAVFLHLALHAIDESRREAADKSDRLEEEMARREEAEESLLRAQKLEALGRLTGGIAHDFNNILTVLIAQSALLAEEAERRDPGGESLAQIREIQGSAERAAGLTSRLLGFARPQVGRPQVVDVGDALTRLGSMMRRVLPENIRFAVAPHAEALHVRIDPDQLDQVLLNLVLNARDAMPTGGTLGVSCEPEELDARRAAQLAGAQAGPYLAIAVSDTGRGIAAEDLERIFDPFFTTKALGHGTGLGLSTVHGIVTRAGGHVDVRSAPGRGTTLRVLLPRIVAARPAARPAQPAPPPRPARRGTVLVCEDEAPVRHVIDMVLGGAGYRVLVAASGELALEVARRHVGDIDLLVTDVVMPGMSGPELAETLRAERPELQVLLVTGYATADVTAAVRDAQLSLLEKPFTPESLLARVTDLMSGGAETARAEAQLH